VNARPPRAAACHKSDCPPDHRRRLHRSRECPDGTAYVGLDSNQLLRTAPDGTQTEIIGTGTLDPGTTAQTGLGTTLNLTPLSLAVTAAGNLLIGSGHVVYGLLEPAGAG
jgi:hypothetical protein